jgi:hypothetical protein
VHSIGNWPAASAHLARHGIGKIAGLRVRGAAVLAALLALAGCDSGQVAKEPSLPPPHLISGSIDLPPKCTSRPQSPDQPGEPSFAVDPSDPTLLVAVWQENRSPDDVGIVVAVTHDGGANWVRSALPSVLTCTGGPYLHAADPWVSIGKDGVIYVSELVTGPPSTAGPRRDIIVSVSRDHGSTWEGPVVVESVTTPPSYPDKDAMLADPRRPGLAYVVWAEYGATAKSISSVDQVFFARTTDAGRSWSKPAPIYSGNDEAQQNQLLMTTGGVLIDVFVEGSSLPSAPHPPPLPVKIRVIRSTDQGQTWSAPIDAAKFTYTNAVDPGTGTQLRFFGQDIVATATGNAVYVAWFENHSDFSTIRVARSEDAGLHWRPSQVVVREKPEAFLPTLAVAGDGAVGMLWFDLRHFAPGSPRLDTDVWFSTSRDRGARWTHSHAAGPFDLRSAPKSTIGPFIGDYMGLVGLPDGFAAVFVQAKPQSRNGPTDVFFSRISGSS